MGYHMAGFEVTGVDWEPQPAYPFKFWQDDVMNITDRQAISISRNFDAVAASPPCQGYSVTENMSSGMHPRLIGPTREFLEFIGLPFVIENVPGAPLREPVQLCGSAFGLRVRRHRLFESNMPIRGIQCNHGWQESHKPYACYGTREQGNKTGVVGVYGFPNESMEGIRNTELRRIAMGIDWMNGEELCQAIPPAYTFFLGRQLIRMLE